MKKRKHLIAALLCVLYVLSMLVSSAFILYEAGHDCTSEQCPVCQAVLLSSQLLCITGAVIITFVYLLGIMVAQRTRQYDHAVVIPCSGTLVDWNIRLNN